MFFLMCVPFIVKEKSKGKKKWKRGAKNKKKKNKVTDYGGVSGAAKGRSLNKKKKRKAIDASHGIEKEREGKKEKGKTSGGKADWRSVVE